MLPDNLIVDDIGELSDPLIVFTHNVKELAVDVRSLIDSVSNSKIPQSLRDTLAALLAESDNLTTWSFVRRGLWSEMDAARDQLINIEAGRSPVIAKPKGVTENITAALKSIVIATSIGILAYAYLKGSR
ncbi:MAG: hypothetical protein HOK84_04740 [Bacteroidetes bacterium]|jgi:hypothetical protein|nr:hypothetical protein [Bacteroidota bacterium]MBT7617807.1 hypothetical protein [Calditrichota bacterium]